MKATLLRIVMLILAGVLIGIALDRAFPGGALPWWFFAAGAAGCLFCALTVPD